MKQLNKTKIKMKSKKSFCKRFFLTGTGKVKYFARGRRHGLSNKNRKHNRLLARNRYLPSGAMKVIKRMISFI